MPYHKQTPWAAKINVIACSNSWLKIWTLTRALAHHFGRNNQFPKQTPQINTFCCQKTCNRWRKFHDSESTSKLMQNSHRATRFSNEENVQCEIMIWSSQNYHIISMQSPSIEEFPVRWAITGWIARKERTNQRTIEATDNRIIINSGG